MFIKLLQSKFDRMCSFYRSLFIDVLSFFYIMKIRCQLAFYRTLPIFMGPGTVKKTSKQSKGARLGYICRRILSTLFS